MTLKCFDVVKAVLDETYEEIADDKGSRDKSIRAAIKATSAQYKDNLMSEGGPNFADPATRFGYVYTYVPAHAHWVFELIEKSDKAKAALASGKVRMTCIGGGPGSDIVGVLKYVDESGDKCKIFAEIIDGCPQWKTTWQDVAFQLDIDGELHTDYVIHDIGDDGTWESPSSIHRADIVTLNFFVSEIHHLGKTARQYLEEMLGRLKKGAVVLVNDNRTAEVQQMMDAVAKKTGLVVDDAGEGERKIYDWGERMDALKEYKAKFGASSRLEGKMFYRIFSKP